MNILTSAHQLAKTVEIPSRFKFRFSLFFALFQDVSNTLQYITRTEKKEQQITNDERENVPSDQSTELHVMEKEKKSYLQFYVKKSDRS